MAKRLPDPPNLLQMARAVPISGAMTAGEVRDGDAASDGNDFCCSLTATLIARVKRVAGAEAVGQLLREARSARTVEYLTDIANWLSYDEVIALLEAGRAITGDRDFAR